MSIDTLPITGQELEETQYEHPSRSHVATPEPSRLARKAREVIYEMDRINRGVLAVLTDESPSEQAMRRFRATMVIAHHYAKERRERRLGRA